MHWYLEMFVYVPTFSFVLRPQPQPCWLVYMSIKLTTAELTFNSRCWYLYLLHVEVLSHLQESRALCLHAVHQVKLPHCLSALARVPINSCCLPEYWSSNSLGLQVSLWGHSSQLILLLEMKHVPIVACVWWYMYGNDGFTWKCYQSPINRAWDQGYLHVHDVHREIDA